MGAWKSQCNRRPTDKAPASSRPSLKAPCSRPLRSRAQSSAKVKGKKRAASGTESESTDDEDDRRTKRSSKTNHWQSKRARFNESDAEVVEVNNSEDEVVEVGAGWSNEGSSVWIPDAFDKTWNTNVSTNRHPIIRVIPAQHSGAKLPATLPSKKHWADNILTIFSDKCMVKFTHTEATGEEQVEIARGWWCNICK